MPFTTLIKLLYNIDPSLVRRREVFSSFDVLQNDSFVVVHSKLENLCTTALPFGFGSVFSKLILLS